jgi:hypothetical protein
MKDSDYTQREGSETRIIERCLLSPKNDKRDVCALHCNLDKIRETGFRGRRRAKRIDRLRKQWPQAVVAAGAKVEVP